MLSLAAMKNSEEEGYRNPYTVYTTRVHESSDQFNIHFKTKKCCFTIPYPVLRLH